MLAKTGYHRNVNLIVCPSRLFAIYMLAYIDEFGLGRKFEIFVANKSSIPEELDTLANLLNSRFINEHDLKDRRYDELIIHSYFNFGLQTSFIEHISFDRLGYFSDGFRNGLYGLPKIDSRLHKLIYFGVKIKEKSFEDGLSVSIEKLESEVVSLSNVRKIWMGLLESNPIASDAYFNSSDFLLVMRYWGQPGVHYPFMIGKTMQGYLRDELSGLHPYKRLIYRSHPQFNHEIQKSELQRIVGDKVEVVLWEELFKPAPHFPELREPEAMIWRSSIGPGLFFGFDSSLNLLVSKNWSQTKIVWPREVNYSEYFEIPRTTNVVSEQIKWMRELTESSEKVEKPLSFRTNGSGMNEVVSASMLWSMNSELGIKTQERDALTQERDALTQERDALTQERDALVNSTIWRATRFIRAFVSWTRRAKRG